VFLRLLIDEAISPTAHVGRDSPSGGLGHLALQFSRRPGGCQVKTAITTTPLPEAERPRSFGAHDVTAAG